MEKQYKKRIGPKRGQKSNPRVSVEQLDMEMLMGMRPNLKKKLKKPKK